MDIATLVYKKYLQSKGRISKRFWYFGRLLLIKLLNPTCTLPIHARYLKIPLSHNLPYLLEQHQFYDRLPQRISEYVHRTYGYLTCIDVGANIGDTIASFYKDEQDTFLAIEPNPSFNSYLIANWGWNKNVTKLAVVCSSESSTMLLTIQEKNGTASIIETDNGVLMEKKPLDTLVKENSAFTNTNVLKIDTDGHDFQVITGAVKLISTNLPIILFECDSFANTTYVEDCLRVLNLFKDNGYNYFLVYDNVGHLIGKYPLNDLNIFKKLLFYQLTSSFYYFDILIMKDVDIDMFYKSEIDYFVDKIPNKSLQMTAKTAAEL